MEFKDYFSAQSDIYVKSRPTYPDELFRFLASLVKTRDLAYDCATGNGQAALSLAKYFKQVIATDGSEKQIKNAVPNEKVKYAVALADNSGIETGTVDLVTIASALHWMDFDLCFKEVNRVLKPGGVFAAWTYCDNHVDDAVDKIVRHFSRVTLADYWPPERQYVFNFYKNLPFPYKEIKTPLFKARIMGNLEFLLRNISTWSSTQKYVEVNGKNPIDLIRKGLEDAWGEPSEVKEISWDLALKVGRKF